MTLAIEVFDVNRVYRRSGLELLKCPKRDIAESTMLCSACSGLIDDIVLFKVGDEFWHEKCLKCSLCEVSLNDKCYEKFGSLFCAKDYYRQFSPHRCFVCNVGISPTDIVYKLKPNTICHVECQRCSVCSVKLGQGAKIGVDELGRRLLCSQHLTSKLSTSNFNVQCQSISKSEPTGDMIRNTMSNPCCDSRYDSIPEEQIIIDGTASARYVRRRGPRTTIRPSQLDMLNRTFNNTPKPSKHTRAKLALETGLSMRVIQVWFQNRRSKERRLKHLCNRLREYEGTSNCDLGASSADSLVHLEESDSDDMDDDEPLEKRKRLRHSSP